MDFDLSARGFCGIVLAGGTAVRMDGIDKASIEIGGRTLLERSIEAFLDADEVVVVGVGTVRTTRPVTFVREDPPHGGPAAGLLTGVDTLLHRPTLVGVVAVDMPHVTAYTLRRLREAAAGHDAAFLSRDGRRQLCGVLDAARLAEIRPPLEDQHGMALHTLLAPLDVVDVPAEGDEGLDIDTWEDLRDVQQ